jgi:biopolymer transport protein ExbB
MTAVLLAAWALGATSHGAVAETKSLRQAYQREFVFLAEQKRELGKRMKSFSSRAKKTEVEQERAVAHLEAQLLQLEARASALQDNLADVERESETSADDTQLIASVKEQAGITLKARGATVPPPADTDEETLAVLFSTATEMLARMASQRQEPGEFFLGDGTRTEGTIVKLGEVASFGVAEGGAGILAPAGGGALKVWDPAQPSVARALAEGKQPANLTLFLYDSIDKQATVPEEQTVLQHVAAGGSIAWVIVFLGLVGVALVLLRSLLLRRAATDSATLVDRIGPLVRDGRIGEARKVCAGSGGSAARIIAVLLERVDSAREKQEDAVSEALLAESERVGRFSTTILVIAAVSPLLGLLGTVTGMIATFDVITQFGTGDPKMLSGGISTALITTELGLIVAIPTLFLGSLLGGWAERITGDLERAALATLNTYDDVRMAESAPPPEAEAEVEPEPATPEVPQVAAAETAAGSRA